MNKKLSLELTILLVCGLFMITTPITYAAEGEDSSGDNGSDSQQKDEGNDESSSEGSDSSEDNKQQDDSSGDNQDDQSEKEKTHNENKQDEKGIKVVEPITPKQQAELDAINEKEKAAQEDYIEDQKTDAELPKVIPQIKEDTIKEDTSHRTEEIENNDPCNYYGRNICEGSPDGKTCNDDKFDCLSDTKDGNYCTTGKCPGDDKPHDDCMKKYPNSHDRCDHRGQGQGDKWNNGDHDNHDHHSHGDHDHKHDHDHNYHNDKHYHNHNDNKYYYYYSNDYSDNHATVILQLDYHDSNSHDDIRLEIGNDFDTVINFAGEPEDLVVTGLDLDEGERFDVCLENLDSDKVNCVETEIYDEDKATYVDIRVP